MPPRWGRTNGVLSAVKIDDWGVILPEKKWPKSSPHDLRRTCGSWLVQAGVSLHEVAKLLRHSDVRVTEKIYAHLAPENLAKAVSVLDQRMATADNGIGGEIEFSDRTA